MADRTSKKRPARASTPEICDLIPQMVLLPDENPIQYGDLRAAFLSDLAPGSPYETALAENLVDLEWETLRHRRLRDVRIREAFREIARERILAVRMFDLDPSKQSETADRIVPALLGSDDAAHQHASDELEAFGLSSTELVALSYTRSQRHLEPHERKLADLEVRRRRLRADYDRLKAARARVVPDAEIIEGP